MASKNSALRLVSSRPDHGSDPSGALTASAEKRRHPRFETHILAEARNEAGEIAIGLITDLSFSGLRLEGSRQMLDTLLPNVTRENQHIPAPVQIHFELPGQHSLNATAVLKGGATYTRRKAQGTYQVGMHFIDILEGIQALSDYLSERGAI